jgi:hypothetical protein
MATPKTHRFAGRDAFAPKSTAPPPTGSKMIQPAIDADLYRPLPNVRLPVGGSGLPEIAQVNPFANRPRPKT